MCTFLSEFDRLSSIPLTVKFKKCWNYEFAFEMQTFAYGKIELKTTKFFSTIFSSITYKSQIYTMLILMQGCEMNYCDLTMRDFKFSIMREKMVTIILI